MLPLLRLPLTPLEPKHRVYIVNQPDFVRQICLTHRDKYRTHKQLVEKLKLVLGLDSGELLTSVGEEWVQRKTTLQPRVRCGHQGCGKDCPAGAGDGRTMGPAAGRRGHRRRQRNDAPSDQHFCSSVFEPGPGSGGLDAGT
jgi:hypothetical protein